MQTYWLWIFLLCYQTHSDSSTPSVYRHLETSYINNPPGIYPLMTPQSKHPEREIMLLSCVLQNRHFQFPPHPRHGHKLYADYISSISKIKKRSRFGQYNHFTCHILSHVCWVTHLCEISNFSHGKVRGSTPSTKNNENSSGPVLFLLAVCFHFSTLCDFKCSEKRFKRSNKSWLERCLGWTHSDHFEFLEQLLLSAQQTPETTGRWVTWQIWAGSTRIPHCCMNFVYNIVLTVIAQGFNCLDMKTLVVFELMSWLFCTRRETFRFSTLSLEGTPQSVGGIIILTVLHLRKNKRKIS